MAGTTAWGQSTENNILMTCDLLTGGQISVIAYYCSSVWGTVVTVSHFPGLWQDSWGWTSGYKVYLGSRVWRLCLLWAHDEAARHHPHRNRQEAKLHPLRAKGKSRIEEGPELSNPLWKPVPKHLPVGPAFQGYHSVYQTFNKWALHSFYHMLQKTYLTTGLGCFIILSKDNLLYF